MNEEPVLWNRTQNVQIAAPLFVPEGFWARGLGLLVRPPLQAGQGLWLAPAGGIHTWGMRYPIAVVFADANLRVLRVLPRMPPQRVALAPRGTRAVAELSLDALLPRTGDQLEVRT
jgi:hypothetical protein